MARGPGIPGGFDRVAYNKQWHKDHPGYRAVNRRLRTERGVCLDCNTPVVPGLRYCEKHSRKQSENARIGQERNRDLVFTLLGGRCAHCGNDDWRVLQLDHKNGGGAEERRQFNTRGNWKQTGPYLRHILEHINQYQLLCANCHAIKTNKEAACRWCNEEEERSVA